MSDTPKTAINVPRLGEIGLNNFAPYLMNRIMGRYNASLREAMAAMGLSVPKIRTLAVLSVMDGVLTGELAVLAVIEQSTLTRTLDALVAEALVRRQADVTDNRATRIFITKPGRLAFENMWPTMAETYGDMFTDITKDERRAFVGTLQKILNNVRQHDI